MVVRLGAIAADKHADLKELIVEILGNEFPLAAKRIYNTISRKYGKQVTYHAVYKAINALLDAKVIAKRNMKYSLNKEYIDRVCDFADRVSVLYGKEKPEFAEEFLRGKFTLKKFGSQYDMGLFILNILKDCKKDEIIAISWPAAWPPMLNVEEMRKPILQIAAKTKEAYCVTSKVGFLDNIFAEKWKKIGMKIKQGEELSKLFDIFAFKDMVILFLQPPNRRFQKYKYLHLIRNLNFMKMSDVFLPILKEHTEIYGFVIKNSEVANKIKQEIMSHF